MNAPVHPDWHGRDQGDPRVAADTVLLPEGWSSLTQVVSRSSRTMAQLPSGDRGDDQESGSKTLLMADSWRDSSTLAPSGHDAITADRSDPTRIRRRCEAEPDARFQTHGSLGSGGMGEVLLARQHPLDRSVALKVIRPDRVSVGPMMQREALLTAVLGHPHIVTVHDAGPGWMAMRWLRGRSLSACLGEVDLTTVIAMLQRVAEALSYAHSCGVIHRDIKPSNIMVADNGVATLIDWGLAVAVDSTAPAAAPRLDEANACAGTPSYLAPEQARGDLARIGPATDIYLLGATLYHVLTGSPPHRAETVMEVLRRASRNRPAPVPDGLPQALVRLCWACLDDDPVLRPDARSFAAACGAWLRASGAEAEARAALGKARSDLALARGRQVHAVAASLAAIAQGAAALPSLADEAAAGHRLAAAARVRQALRDGDLGLAAAQLPRTDDPALREALSLAQERRRRHQRMSRWARRGLGLAVGLLLLLAGLHAMLRHQEIHRDLRQRGEESRRMIAAVSEADPTVRLAVAQRAAGLSADVPELREVLEVAAQEIAESALAASAPNLLRHVVTQVEMVLGPRPMLPALLEQADAIDPVVQRRRQIAAIDQAVTDPGRLGERGRRVEDLAAWIEAWPAPCPDDPPQAWAARIERLSQHHDWRLRAALVQAAPLRPDLVPVGILRRLALDPHSTVAYSAAEACWPLLRAQERVDFALLLARVEPWRWQARTWAPHEHPSRYALGRALSAAQAADSELQTQAMLSQLALTALRLRNLMLQHRIARVWRQLAAGASQLPGDPLARMMDLLHEGRPDDAIRLFEQELSTYKTITGQVPRHWRSLSTYLGALCNHRPVAVVLRHIDDLGPDFGANRLSGWRSHALALGGDLNRAEAVLVENMPRVVEQGLIYYMALEQAWALGRPDLALAWARLMYQGDPVSAYVVAVVQCLIALDRIDEALVLARDHKAVHVDQAVSHRAEAEALLAAGHHDQAVAAARRALALAPSHETVHLHGRCLLAAGEHRLGAARMIQSLMLPRQSLCLWGPCQAYEALSAAGQHQAGLLYAMGRVRALGSRELSPVLLTRLLDEDDGPALAELLGILSHRHGDREAWQVLLGCESLPLLGAQTGARLRQRIAETWDQRRPLPVDQDAWAKQGRHMDALLAAAAQGDEPDPQALQKREQALREALDPFLDWPPEDALQRGTWDESWSSPSTDGDEPPF